MMMMMIMALRGPFEVVSFVSVLSDSRPQLN